MVDSHRVEGSLHLTVEPVLTECGRLLILRLIKVATDFISCGHFLCSLKHHDVLIDLNNNNVPKLNPTVKKSVRNNANVDMFFSALATVISDCILRAYPVRPTEVNDLLNAMSQNAHKHLDLIGSHPCLVPIENMREYFLRAQQEISDLKSLSITDYQKALQGIVYPSDWETLIQSNQYLVQMYNKRPGGMGKKGKGAGQLQHPKANVAAPPQIQAISVSK